MIKLIATDMDGSLLDKNSCLPPEFFNVLEKIQKKGIRFIVASGRSYDTLYDQFDHKQDQLDYISDNGTRITENGEITYKSILKPSHIANIIRICEKIEGIYVILCGINAAYVKGSKGWFLNNINRYYSNSIITNDLYTVNDEIFKVGIYDTLGGLNNSHKHLYSKFSNELTVVLSGKEWVDVMNKNANKGNALEIIQKKYKISKEETMAFGDYYNDIEMLGKARYSFVMENANPDMKKYGNYIAKSNNKYGVTEAIKKYILK